MAWICSVVLLTGSSCQLPGTLADISYLHECAAWISVVVGVVVVLRVCLLSGFFTANLTSNVYLTEDTDNHDC